MRLALGLKPTDPLEAEKLAAYLKVSIWSVHDIGLPDEDLHQLVHKDADSWSAITVSAFGRDAIIANPNHPVGRHASNVMHELAHLILRHEPSTVFFVGDAELALRAYNPSAEEEANWLAGALLLPREALVHCKRYSISDQQAGAMYGVSLRMLSFRQNVTGVNQQFGRRKR